MSSLHPDVPAKAPRQSIGPGKIAGMVGFGVVALCGLTTGFSGVMVFAGLYLFTTGIWAVVRRSSWLGKNTRRAGAGILAGGLVLMMAGSAAAGPSTEQTPAASAPTSSARPPASSAPSVSPIAQPSPTPTEPSLEDQAALLPAPELAGGVDVQSAASTATPQTALATAMLLEVKGRAPKTGYNRDLFGSGWVDVDRNGCDTRNDILARDLEPKTFKPGTNNCVVLTGTLADPYSAKTINFIRGNETSNAVQIDHVVALSDAWQKGAQAWDGTRRIAFANDPMALLAVDGPLNMQKGDGDTATWLPPNKAYRCQYVARQVGVKYTYGLWVTEAERDAMVSVLSNCPGEPLPSGSAVPAAPAPAAVAEPAPAPLAAPAPAPAADVYYANCAAARAAGAAPVHRGDPGYRTALDRDGDGIGCE